MAPVETPVAETPGDKVKTRQGEVELVGINPEGILSAAVPAPTEEEPLTIVGQKLVTGFGGPIAVQSERGLYKALGGDGIFELSNGVKYVMPKELADALGVTLPEIEPEEQKKLDEQLLTPEAFREKYPPDVEGSAAASGSGGGDGELNF